MYFKQSQVSKSITLYLILTRQGILHLALQGLVYDGTSAVIISTVSLQMSNPLDSQKLNY